MTGYREAVEKINECLRIMPSELCFLYNCAGRVSAENLLARVDCPNVSTSKRDGYAVRRWSVSGGPESGFQWPVTGYVKAGDSAVPVMAPGTALKINTGAPVPLNADVIVPIEQVTELYGDDIFNPLPASIKSEYLPLGGRNILSKGGDVAKNSRIVEKFEFLTPAHASALAAAGYNQIPVIRKPVCGLIGVGSELVMPGKDLPAGSLYASNLMMQAGWLNQLGIPFQMTIAKDSKRDIALAISNLVDKTDMICLSGGAWKSGCDLTEEALYESGWTKIFHYLRLGPGKSTGFGILNRKPVFILSGSPISNETAFIKLVLPALRLMTGCPKPLFQKILVTLGQSLNNEPGWTQVAFVRLDSSQNRTVAYPIQKNHRMEQRLHATASITVGEQCSSVPEGSTVLAHLFSPMKMFFIPVCTENLDQAMNFMDDEWIPLMEGSQ